MWIELSTLADGRIRCKSPYSGGFVARARELGGTWDPAARIWIFPADARERLIDALERYYGWLPDELHSHRTVRVTLTREDAWLFRGKSWVVMGRRLLSRTHRDWAVYPGDDVKICEGEFRDCGGSRARPRIGAPHGFATLEIADCTDRFIEELRKLCYGDVVEVQPREVERDALEAQARHLRMRLAEVERRLARIDSAAHCRRAGETAV